MNFPLIDRKGFYGDFGGAFVPEILWPDIEYLQKNYRKILNEKDFQVDFQRLLIDYAGRPSPLFFSNKLSKKHKARIYLKREDLNHTGAHKINNAIGQALLAKKLGKSNIIAETGAGQHGVATATVCALLDLKCTIFMGAIDIKRQAPNVARMKMLGAKIIPASGGNQTLKDAVNAVLRYWINNPNAYYLAGSVVGPHPYPEMVAYFQSVISEEIKKQLLEKEGREKPDYVIACIGGGSNAAGAFYHFLTDLSVSLIAVEAAGLGINTDQTAATTVKGSKGVLHGSMTLVMQNKDGQVIEPYSISAGLDYPGIGPMHAYLFQSQRARFLNITDKEALKAAYELAQLEGILPALESAHAVAALSKLSLKKEDLVILNISGRGDKDMENYIKNINQFSRG